VQLTREQQQQQNVADAMKRLQDAADAMKRAAANGSRDGGAQATEALARLREAQQKLERNQNGRTDRDLKNAQRQADELAQEQKQTQADVNNLDQAGANRAEKAQAIGQRKDAMDAKIADLQKQLEAIANDMRRDEKDAARKLDEAAGSIRDKRIREMMRYTRQALNSSGNQYARGMEESLSNNLDALSKKIADAQGAMGKSAKSDAVARAAERARDLVRGMESSDQRMRERGSKGSQGSTGSQGSQQQGSQGSQGSTGSQGSQGSQGSRDAQGQAGGRNADGGGARNGGYGDTNGTYTGGYWNGGYGYWNPDDIRQFRRDYRERLSDAQALRRELQQAGVPTRELDDIIRDLERFDNDRLYADPKGLEQLQASATDKMKKFEFQLRKKADGDDQPLSLSGSDEVPAGFRTAIEEYYRSLAKKK